jgi:predicted nucleic acid-binding protein
VIYLIDTNILLRLADRDHEHYAKVHTAVLKLQRSGHELRAAFQNYVEFWSVVTRPATNNGLGFTPVEAERLRSIEQIFPLLPDAPTIYAEWRQLVVAFGISGVQVHDARLVAAMRANGVTHILTLNTSDFTRYASSGLWLLIP